MSGPIARASPPDKPPCKIGMKTSPSKRASSLHINTALGARVLLDAISRVPIKILLIVVNLKTATHI